ncbi:hypothetical protein P7K49_029892 [Saguinus oedipus]|uniref:Uncharacterized protein n=1 Tax=Saguinus oedipus TaxID=9490 RepID=A0ABQ9U8K1_SAGOE|nr:hypothetical protein P7K49_029892 [Saguinus oedipus]
MLWYSRDVKDADRPCEKLRLFGMSGSEGYEGFIMNSSERSPGTLWQGEWHALFYMGGSVGTLELELGAPAGKEGKVT